MIYRILCEGREHNPFFLDIWEKSDEPKVGRRRLMGAYAAGAAGWGTLPRPHWHPECTRDLRLSRIAIDDQLGTKKSESRQSTLLMDKHRQMAIKVVHLSIPLLKGDLRIDVRDSRRKDR